MCNMCHPIFELNRANKHLSRHDFFKKKFNVCECEHYYFKNINAHRKYGCFVAYGLLKSFD